jgi:hypothetical protein
MRFWQIFFAKIFVFADVFFAKTFVVVHIFAKVYCAREKQIREAVKKICSFSICSFSINQNIFCENLSEMKFRENEMSHNCEFLRKWKKAFAIQPFLQHC